jgi:hypothetical protein
MLSLQQVEQAALGKQLLVEYTQEANGGAGGYFLYDEYRLDCPDQAGPMFGATLEVALELIAEYQPSASAIVHRLQRGNHAASGNTGSQGPQCAEIEPRRVPVGGGTGGAPEAGEQASQAG